MSLRGQGRLPVIENRPTRARVRRRARATKRRRRGGRAHLYARSVAGNRQTRGGVRKVRAISPGVSGVLFAEATVDALKKAIADANQITFDPALIRANSLRFSPQRFRDRFGEFISGKSR